MTSDDQIDVFVGVDVGKAAHYAVALTRDGKVLLSRAVPQDEQAIRGLLADLADEPSRILLVVDQPATVGALVVAVARDAGVRLGYLPGLAMRRLADVHAGEAKTDAKDALVIAEAARSMPLALRALPTDAEQVAELSVLAGFDDDLAKQVNSASTRLRAVLTEIHPALERVLGPELDHVGILDLLVRYPVPVQMAAAGRARIRRVIAKRSPRLPDDLADRIHAALQQQTVEVPGTQAYATVICSLARQLDALLAGRKSVGRQLEEMVAEHPLSQVLTSMPGVGFRTAARIVTEIAGKDFPTSGHLAAYCGLAPVSRRSGSSIRGEHQPRGGNKRLKRILFLSAFAALADPVSRTYYDGNDTRVRATRKPCSLWQDGVQMSSMPCCATAPSTTPTTTQPLDKRHRGTNPFDVGP